MYIIIYIYICTNAHASELGSVVLIIYYTRGVHIIWTRWDGQMSRASIFHFGRSGNPNLVGLSAS